MHETDNHQNRIEEFDSMDVFETSNDKDKIHNNNPIIDDKTKSPPPPSLQTEHHQLNLDLNPELES